MIEEYEINKNTLAILPYKENYSYILEEDNEFIVSKNVIKIIDESCKFFGSSYIGRFEGAKKIIGKNYKTPIIIEESNEIIFFPTHSPRKKECNWINIKKILKIEKKDFDSQIIFINQKKLAINISINILENQLLRANLLKSIISSRKQQ